MGVDDPRDAHPAARELAHGQRVGGQVEPEPAVLLGNREAEDAELAQALHDLVGEGVGALVLGGHRDDLLVGELAHQLDDLALLLAELIDGQAHAAGPGQSHASGLTAGDHLGGDLARGLVDHLALVHDRSPALDLGGVVVGVQQPAGGVELVLRGHEHLVGDLHLAGVQHPLAVEADRAGAVAQLAVGVGVLDIGERPVDRLQPVGARGGDDGRDHEVPLVTRVGGVDAADRELGHPDVGGIVAGAEDQRLDAVGGGRDLVQVDSSPGRLDLGLDADLVIDPALELELAQQVIDEVQRARRPRPWAP